MSRQELLAALKEVGASAHAQFADEVGTHSGRLTQLDHALATAAMAVGHLFDEEDRELDLAQRVLEQTASSPVGGRGRDHYKAVAARGNQ